MNRLSYWAKSNPVPARWLIVLSQVLVGIISFVSVYFFRDKIHLPSAGLLAVLCAFTVVSFLIYPAVVNRKNHSRRKVLNMVFMLCSFGLMLAVWNQWLPSVITISDSSASQVAVSQGNASYVILLLLLWGGVFGLGWLVAMLACNLSCNGYEAMAWIVLLGGWGGLLVVLVTGTRLLILSMRQNDERQKAAEEKMKQSASSSDPQEQDKAQ